jgi:hypothetical protein
VEGMSALGNVEVDTDQQKLRYGCGTEGNRIRSYKTFYFRKAKVEKLSPT